MPRELPIEEVHPTQLYLSSEKLGSVAEWFDFDDPEYDPLPAFEHEGSWYLADGHTRAFVAYLAGAESLLVRRDEAVREECDFDLYLECIEWCEDAGVDSPADFSGRILGPETFQYRWVDRCSRAAGRTDE
jgi:hypothetical protein